MHYDEVVNAMFLGDDRPAPAIVEEASPARRLRDAFEPVAMHAVWSPLVHERSSAIGLDFFGTYVWGRACVLGEPTGAIVAAAFAAFEPSMLCAVYDAARAVVSRDAIVQLTVDTTGESLGRVLGPVDTGAVIPALRRAVEQADPTGRPLFAGVQSMPWPTDSYAQLWQLCLALREHRGDGHVISYLAEGFDSVQMNILTELWLGYPLGEYSATRAWSPERTADALSGLEMAGFVAGTELTSMGRARRQLVEDSTDDLEEGIIEAIGDDFEQVVELLEVWSAACVAARTFPPDPRKRAAG